jgi:hypothetical protein
VWDVDEGRLGEPKAAGQADAGGRLAELPPPAADSSRSLDADVAGMVEKYL